MVQLLDKPFKPSSSLKTLYFTYLILGTIGTMLCYSPAYFAANYFDINLLITLPVIIVSVLVALWIPLFYDSINYKLTKTEIIWRRGVWFRNTGIVPYNRITNIDINQGPISRILNIASLKIQTAGYSGTTSAEIRLNGIENFEALREQIMNFVRGSKGTATETYDEKNNSSKMLEELVLIRKLLSKK
ncbi:Bacterial PH domain protein [Candidatus Tiddalikarchaeum anstoanum]|nr:Bacterial PH domain protein [Candidatus Tiddalikarchaeum anstoanum]